MCCFSVAHTALQQYASVTATSMTYTTTKSESCPNIMMHIGFEMSLTSLEDLQISCHWHIIKLHWWCNTLDSYMSYTVSCEPLWIPVPFCFGSTLSSSIFPYCLVNFLCIALTIYMNTDIYQRRGHKCVQYICAYVSIFCRRKQLSPCKHGTVTIA